MKSIANPMEVLLASQQALNNGQAVDPSQLVDGYLRMYDEPNGGRRYSFVKIAGAEVQALSIFGLEEPIKGIVCYSVAYAVSEAHRRRGLAVEAVDMGLRHLRNELSRTGLEHFYLDAVIDVTNIASVQTAKKIFPDSPTPIVETYSLKPALHFSKLISLP